MILVEQIHELFDLWQDKVGAPYFTSDQKDLFIQRASVQFVNQYLKNPSSHVLEETHVDTEDVNTLMHQANVSSLADGRITFVQINAALPTGKSWMYFMSAGRGATVECSGDIHGSRWVRHNDYRPQKRNSFKKPEVKYPIHRYFSDYIQFEPKGKASTEITVLVYPNVVTLDDPNDSGTRGTGAIDLDLPNKVFNEIVYLSLAQAGINMREQDFYQFVEREIGKNV